MRTGKQILLFFVLFLASGSVLYERIRAVPPSDAALVHLLEIYGLIFLSAASLAATLGFYARRALSPKSSPYSALVTSRRQGALLGLLAACLLALKALALFNIWTALTLIVVFMLFEMYLQ